MSAFKESKLTLAAAFALLFAAFPLCFASAEEDSAKQTREKEAAEATHFLRLLEDDEAGLAQLQTAVVTYENSEGVTVDLVSAVHIAEQEYYAALNELFTAYDAMLYELVGDKEAVSSAEAVGMNTIGVVQRWMKDRLGLEHQLGNIDYTPENFVHADMDLRDFIDLQREKGENLFSYVLRSMQYDMEKRRKGEPIPTLSPFQLYRLLFGKGDDNDDIKLMLARQFSNMDEMIKVIEGPEGSVILTERNKVAFAVLAEQLELGRKTLAVFYGAAHLPDMEARLLDMGFERRGQKWLTAWNMDLPKKRAPKAEAGEEEASEEPSGEAKAEEVTAE